MPPGTENIILTSAQLRAARALLRWTGERLAGEAGVGIQTIRRAELTDGPLRMIPANVRVIRAALEAAGVDFISENGGGPGVRLRHPEQIHR